MIQCLSRVLSGFAHQGLWGMPNVLDSATHRSSPFVTRYDSASREGVARVHLESTIGSFCFQDRSHTHAHWKTE